MAKTNKTKAAGDTMASDKTNAAFSVDRSSALMPADDNPSKFQPTPDAEMDTLQLDPSDGVLKLFTDCIKDIYWAENHLVKALPKMIKAASLPVLQENLTAHLEETKNHVVRLEQVFELLGKTPQAKKCDAMEGLTKEGEGVIETTDMGTPARNLGIILSSQKVEHYEISSYTGLVKIAESLGLTDVAALLSATLQEEETADGKLASIAQDGILSTKVLSELGETLENGSHNKQDISNEDAIIDKVEPIDDRV